MSIGKNSLFMVIAIALVGSVVLGGCIGDSEDSTEESESTSTHKIPTEYILMDYTGKTQNTILSKYGSIFTPDNGKIFLIISIELENHGYDEVNTNPYNFELVVDGVAYDHDSNTCLLDTALDTVNVRNGGKTSGTLAFQIPKDSSNTYILEYDDGWNNYNILSTSDILNFEIN